MIGSSSIVSSARVATARCSSLSACQSFSTRSAKRSRSFHMKEILDRDHRPALHFRLAFVDGRAERRIVGDVDGLAERQILIVRDEDGDGSVVAQEGRAVAGQLALADQGADVL